VLSGAPHLHTFLKLVEEVSTGRENPLLAEERESSNNLFRNYDLFLKFFLRATRERPTEAIATGHQKPGSGITVPLVSATSLKSPLEKSSPYWNPGTRPLI
jgi:hypothetical protein